MRDLTIIYPYYDNPLMLSVQLGIWSGYDPQCLEHLEFVIIDDCSPEEPAEPLLKHAVKVLGCPVKLYRLKEDKPWNACGARNVGAHEARPGWQFQSDIDHVLPRAQCHALMTMPLSKSAHYTFSRRWAHKLKASHAHCNTFACTREAFWHVNGFDEDFVWGGDSNFRARLAEVAPVVHLEHLHIENWQEVVPTAKTPRTPEEITFRRQERAEIIKKKLQGQLPVGSENPLRIPYERVL